MPPPFSRLWTLEEEETLSAVNQWRWITSLGPQQLAPVRHTAHERWMKVPGNVYAPGHREVMLTFRGNAVHSLGQQIFKRTPGTVMLFQRHESRDLKGAPHKKAFHCLWLHLSGGDLLTFNSNSCDEKGRYFQELSVGTRSGPQVRQLHAVWDQWEAAPTSPMHFEWLKAHLISLLLEVARSADSNPTLPPHRAVMSAIEQYIQAHLSGDLSLHSLARIAGYSPYFFHRLFVRILGQTPGAYVNALRLQRACELLRQGYTVHATAEQVGFESLSYFNRFFRNATGHPPGAWARR